MEEEQSQLPTTDDGVEKTINNPLFECELEKNEECRSLANLEEISLILTREGLTIKKFIPPNQLPQSIFEGLETWSEDVLHAVIELADRSNRHKESSLKLSSEANQFRNTNDAMYSRIQDLQTVVLDMEKKQKQLLATINLLEDGKMGDVKIEKEHESHFKKQIRSLECQVQEAERRFRQKDIENEKLRLKLKQLSIQERERKDRCNDILDQANRGELVFADMHTGKKSVSSPVKKVSSVSPQSARSPNRSYLSTSSSSSQSQSQSTLLAIIDAFDSSRQELLKKLHEVEAHVKDLSGVPKSVTVDSLPSRPVGLDMDLRTQTHPSVQETVALLTNKFELERRNYEQELAVLRTLSDEHQAQVVQLQLDLRHYLHTIDNLTLELSNRPNRKEFQEVLFQKEELETKLQDLLALRQTTNAMNGWKSHLSTAERIKIDKKNHELKLFLLDSLPKEVLKDTLQMVCRELDVADISEIRGSLTKLKCVIRMVPRMQKFIERVSGYIFSRQRIFEKEIVADQAPPTNPSYAMHMIGSDEDSERMLESVYPILQKWWKTIQHYKAFKTLFDKLSFEFFRRAEILTLATKTHLQPSVVVTSSHIYDEETLQVKYRKEQLDRAGQYDEASFPSVIQHIRELIDVQLELLHVNPTMQGIDKYIQSRPDIFVNGVVNHLRYLFKIHDLQEVVPALNELYLFHQEVNNFLISLRQIVDPNNQKPSLKKLLGETLFLLQGC